VRFLFKRKPYGLAYCDCKVPAVLHPGVTCNAWVLVKNCGSKVWPRNPSNGHRVDLVVYLGGKLSGTFPLLNKQVRSGEQVVVEFSFPAPSKPGIHTIKIDLVEQGVTLFEDQGVEPLLLEFEVAAKEESVIPDGSKNARRLSSLPRYGNRFADYDIPEKVASGARIGAWVCIENCGTLRWERNPSDGNRVDLAVFLDNKLVNTIKMPVPVVRTAERVTVHFAVPAPTGPGPHTLKIDLVHQNVTFFENAGVMPLSALFEVDDSVHLYGGSLYEKALRINSWFYSPSGGISQSRGGQLFPVFASRAEGCHLWDVEGRKYIDYTMGWGCALLGYANERVQRAVMEALTTAGVLPLPHPLLVEVSEMLCEDIPCAEMVAFGKNGSDACTLAMRLARLHTGRRKILVCGYHGWQDSYAELIGYENSGVPDRQERFIYHFKFNNYRDFKALFEEHRNDLAAVMLEPSGPAENIQGPVQDVSKEFLEKVARDTKHAGALLVFDEIITGFRYLKGSVQKSTGVIPDLTCLGKALGAGMPISALVGKADILSGSMARSFYGPTFKDETYSLAAAKEALSIYRSEPVAEHVWDFGNLIKAEVNRLCRSFNLPAEMVGPPFRFALAFREEGVRKLNQLRTLYQQELLKGGVITYNGIMLPSYAHDRAAFDQTMEVMGKALELVAKALAQDVLERYIEMPLLVP